MAMEINSTSVLSDYLAASATLLCAAAMAAPVSLASMQHLYGSGPGRQLASIMAPSIAGSSCDTVNANSITVRATLASTCKRFGDFFDFSAIDFDSIDRFELTLDFGGARNQLASTERWYVRGSSSYTPSDPIFGALNGTDVQTFTFTNTQPKFNDIVATGKFFIYLTTPNGATMNFNLSSARLEVFGEPVVVTPPAQVPEPGSLALMGLSLAALAGVRRMRKATQA